MIPKLLANIEATNGIYTKLNHIARKDKNKIGFACRCLK